MLSLEELFCSVDDFYNMFEPLWHKQQFSNGHPPRKPSLKINEFFLPSA